MTTASTPTFNPTRMAPLHALPWQQNTWMSIPRILSLTEPTPVQSCLASHVRVTDSMLVPKMPPFATIFWKYKNVGHYIKQLGMIITSGTTASQGLVVWPGIKLGVLIWYVVGVYHHVTILSAIFVFVCSSSRLTGCRVLAVCAKRFLRFKNTLN